MAPTSFFDGVIDGSSYGEPNGQTHVVELLEANGQFVLRVEQDNRTAIDLMFTPEQAIDFAHSVKNCLHRIGLAARL